MYYFNYYHEKSESKIQCNFNSRVRYLEALNRAVRDGRMILSCGRLS